MPEFDAFQYLDHLRSRRRFLAAVCAVAAAIALAVSLLVPKEFTATSRLIIEPPPGSDPRAATAVSPVYLESLKTYELFAAGDNLFLHAVDHFGLRQSDSRPIDRMKRSVLKVGIARNTRMLEITVRLGDPKKAQALAQYLAEETVKLSGKVAREGDLELAEAAEQELQAARARLERQRGLRAARRDKLDRRSALAAVSALEKRALDARAAVGSHSERLKVADPGIVPERPSAPNLPLNVLLAVLAALIAALLFVTLEFGGKQARGAGG